MWGNLHSSQMRPSRGLENWLIWVREAQKGLHFKAAPKIVFVQKFSAAIGPPPCSMNQLSPIVESFSKRALINRGAS